MALPGRAVVDASAALARNCLGVGAGDRGSPAVAARLSALGRVDDPGEILLPSGRDPRDPLPDRARRVAAGTCRGAWPGAEPVGRVRALSLFWVLPGARLP